MNGSRCKMSELLITNPYEMGELDDPLEVFNVLQHWDHCTLTLIRWLHELVSKARKNLTC